MFMHNCVHIIVIKGSNYAWLATNKFLIKSKKCTQSTAITSYRHYHL